MIIFGADMSSSVHYDNKRKETLILGEGPTQGLDDSTLTAGAIYHINFTQPNKRFVLRLAYNGSNSSFFNATKIYQFKAEDSDIKYYALYLGKTLKDFTINNMKKKKTRMKRSCKHFSIYFNPIDTNGILDIYKYLIKGT